jgi:hypothetical protein
MAMTLCGESYQAKELSMAHESLREVVQSQLDHAPVIDGQLIVCTDTGSTYRDIGARRTLNQHGLGDRMLVSAGSLV